LHQSGPAELGLFTAANNIRSVVMFVPLTLHAVNMSLLNHEIGAGNFVTHRRMFRSNVLTSILITACLSVAVAYYASTLLSFFGPAFLEASTVLYALSLAAILEATYYAMYQSVLSTGRMWLSLFIVNIPWAGTLLLGAFLLVPQSGSMGLGIAYCAAWACGILGVLFHMWLSRPLTVEGETATGANVPDRAQWKP
jgi:O-antigen/teichoic acid export membrane protein